ncbi:hypothetical protein, partial [Enterocloster asparagiformis]|uniref:hypothetical protein n=1 Tax=Enterocloster asparagiformis TaxID=333367 RepID=UPI002A7EDCA7
FLKFLIALRVDYTSNKGKYEELTVETRLHNKKRDKGLPCGITSLLAFISFFRRLSACVGMVGIL